MSRGACFLGIDTSNYTTSAALYWPESGEVRQVKRLLPVEEGKVGLRQSDAVFAHVKALGGLMEELFNGFDGEIVAVGASTSPRDEAGSYMPCFLTGEMAARSVSAAVGKPFYAFSHQAGHIAAALYATGSLHMAEAPFLAFHISGGTTQCLRVTPDPERILKIETVAETLDLNAGQAVDRVGATLGLPFPAGPALEKLAQGSAERYKPRPTLRGMDCCLSGLENQCAAMLAKGERPEDIARYCLDFIAATLLKMTDLAVKAYPSTPIIYAGGVMANRIIRAAIEAKYTCLFAPPEYSADNAAGIAALAARK
jgi:N6-L-threonylcarbamoyladenine synthase